MFALKQTQEDTQAFFVAVSERKLSDAERILGLVELGLVFYKISTDKNSQKDKKAASQKRVETTLDYIAGYIKALEGVLTSTKASDDRAFMNRNSQDPGTLQSYRRRFSDFRDDDLHSVFDRGFMSAWLDLVNFRINALEMGSKRRSRRQIQ